MVAHQGLSKIYSKLYWTFQQIEIKPRELFEVFKSRQMKNGSLKAAIISTNLDLCHWKSCSAGINQEYFSRLKKGGEKEEKEKVSRLCAG